MNNKVISEIRSLYRDENDLLRTVLKRIYEDWDADREQWCLKKIEFIFEDPEFPVPSEKPAVAVEQHGGLLPPDWEFVSEIWEFERKPVSEVKHDHEGEVAVIRKADIINRAKADFERFHYLYTKVKQAHTAKQEQQMVEMIQLCMSAILHSHAWVQEYKRYILELTPAEYGTTSEGYKWMPMLEGIRDQLPLFRDLLYDQQLDYTWLEVVEKIRREVMELLAERIYLRVF